jgi:hypothetical protein
MDVRSINRSAGLCWAGAWNWNPEIVKRRSGKCDALPAGMFPTSDAYSYEARRRGDTIPKLGLAKLFAIIVCYYRADQGNSKTIPEIR